MMKNKSSSKSMSTRAGSHAGRGFRYQDAVSAWLSIKSWCQEIPYGSLIPEGLDDADLIGPGGRAFVQMKSRRDKLGPYPRGDVSNYIKELWERAESAKNKPVELILIIERDVNGLEYTEGHSNLIDLSDSLGKLLIKHKLCTKWNQKTTIIISSNPVEDSIKLISTKLDCQPIVASIYFGKIADEIGNISDNNGLKSEHDFISFSSSDLGCQIGKLAGSISINDLELPISKGLCEPVDFVTPYNDQNFYLGTDVQPGHLAAGLISERPDERTIVVKLLEEKRLALVTGPSGSGKSGLMWESAFVSRHSVRWFKVNNKATSDDVHVILNLANTYRASNNMPVGFIIDDIGRNRNILWSTFVESVSPLSNVVLLGSLREEDLFLINRKQSSCEVKTMPDRKLAERLWKELSSRNQTEWNGWREPWDMSNGLLLEYVHILSQGKRLEDIIRDQIERRVSEGRYIELDILRVVSLVGSTGAVTDTRRLRDTLSISDYEMSASLKRLLNEHLIQYRDNGSSLGSMHQLRAKTIAEIMHEISPPFKCETIELAFKSLALEGAETFVYRVLKDDFSMYKPVIESAADRINKENNLSLISNILRGLDAASIAEKINLWLPHFKSSGLPKTQATLVAMFAVADIKPILEEKLSLQFELAEKLRKTEHKELRNLLLHAIQSRCAELIVNSINWPQITSLMAALIEMELPENIEKNLISLNPDLLDIPFDDVIKLLETARVLSTKIAVSWVDKIGQNKLLDRVYSEIAWTSKVRICEEEDGIVIYGDIYQVSDKIQENPHENIVNLCRTLLAISPKSEIVASRALSIDGSTLGVNGYEVASKRIKRINLLPEAIPFRNKKWIRGVAESISNQSVTSYLFEVTNLFNSLGKPLEKVINSLIQGRKPVESELNKLGDIYNKSKELIKPLEREDQSGVGTSNLQDVLDYCSSDLIRDIYKLPEQHSASYSKVKEKIELIQSSIDIENWLFLNNEVPTAILYINGILNDLLLIIGESGDTNLSVSQLNL